jgi:Cu+-exporting ATPase
MIKDPVCGTQVDEKTSPSTNFEGKKYAFCGQSCKEKFDANPRQYTHSGEHHHQSGEHHQQKDAQKQQQEQHKARV